jgi:hypothetical protein
MTTGLDVLDTAVKVGLGALLSAGGAYLLAARTQRKEGERERTRRRRELLESVADDVVGFSSTFLAYWARSADAAAKRREGKAPTKEAMKRLIDSRNELFDAFGRLTSAQGRLLLLGEKQAQTLLRDFGEYAGQCRAGTLPSDPPQTEEQYTSMRSIFGAKRDAVFDALAKSYASPAA